MSSCEKCWEDSNSNPLEYSHLVATRNCSPEEEAGRDAQICDNCNRKTIHQYTKECVICGMKQEQS